MDITTLDFNPRSREGSDGRLEEKGRGCRISIHAPAKGATLEVFLVSGFLSFQSTLPRRERLETAVGKAREKWISIHAPAKGATSRAA